MTASMALAGVSPITQNIQCRNDNCYYSGCACVNYDDVKTRHIMTYKLMH